MKPHPSQALVLLLLAPGSPAFAESPACSLFFLGAGSADEYTCTCGPGPYPDAPGAMNDVWGSAPYTTDSDICRAALHAGVIGPKGGEVTAIRAEAIEGEGRGSTAHGVTSFTVGGQYWDTVFTFEGAQAPEPLPDCGPLGEAEELACFCPWGAPRGEVWGSGPYTADSDICAVAYHAGVIDRGFGGNVRVIRGSGQDNYTASTAAGVKASEHGPSDASFTFGAFE